MRKVSFFVLLLFIISISFLVAQPLPSELWLVRDYAAGLDLGMNWSSNSLLKPYSLESVIAQKDSQTHVLWIERDRETLGHRWRSLDGPKVMVWPGVISQWKQGKAETDGSDFRAFFLFGQMNYKNWYANLYTRSATRPDAFSNFTPFDRPIGRAGMHAGEIDQALMGYRNSWAHVSFGRGRQIWGPGLSDNTVLSYGSASYDHFAMQLFYKRWTFAYFHGFLEAIQDTEGKNQIRYIAGRALQYRLFQNGFIALGETSIYYGENRPLDLGNMNPFIPHIENEQNRRENISDGNLSNAIWFVTADVLLPGQFRFSGSIVFDEFQLDRADRDQGRPDAMAYQARLAKSWVNTKSAFTLFGRYDAVGSYTYRHENPYTCFASRDLPLAMSQGSDFYQWTSGFRWILSYRMWIESEYLCRESGENNLKDQMYIPYTEFTMIPFPSGETLIDQQFRLQLLWAIRPNLDCSAGYVMQWLKNSEHAQKESSVFLRINVHWSVLKSL